MVLPNLFTNQVDNDMNFSKQRLSAFKIIYRSLFCPLARQVSTTWSYVLVVILYLVVILTEIVFILLLNVPFLVLRHVTVYDKDFINFS